jgi:hypothetical protein
MKTIPFSANTGFTSRRRGFQSVMNSRLGYFCLESQPELRQNHFMGAGIQNAETGKPAKRQTGVREENNVKK